MEDRRAHFEAQVMPHLDAAYRFARWLTRSSTEADDIVQEAFLRAFRSLDSLRGTDARAWLFAIVRNCHVTARRQEQRRGYVPLPEEQPAEFGAETIAHQPDPESASAAEDDRRMLARLIAALPEEYREVLLLREMEDLSYGEIAAVTQVPIGTVMSRLSRARAALKVRWLEEVRGEPRAVR
jgi:RNA polymerase sigma-70 factor, ECF subfamily